MLRRLFRLVMLRPYGDDLCAPATRHWQFLAIAGVLMMSFAESAAWGYVGWFLGDGALRYLTAFALGAIAGSAAWVVDSSFLCLDLRRREYELMLAHADQRPGQPTKTRFSNTLKSPLAGVLFRLVMAAGSLYIAAPYVSQLFFSSDIAAVLNNEHATATQLRRNEIISSHDAEIARLRREENYLKTQLVNETAGKGPSRRYGRGPTAMAIEAQLTQLESRIPQAQVAAQAELAAYDALSPVQLADKYGVANAGRGIQARNKAMQLIRTQPGYSWTEWTIRTLLLSLFLVLIVLKVYQPISAQIYYSEFCQDCYQLYLAGNLPVMPLHTKGDKAIAELAFDMWLHSDYKDHQRYTRNATAISFIRASETLKEENLKQIQAVAESELAPLLVDLEEVQKQLSATEQEILESESDITATEVRISEHREAIETVDVAISKDPSPGGFAKGFKAMESWRTGLVDLEKTNRAALLSVQKAKTRLSTLQQQAKHIQDAIDSRADVLVLASRHIDDCRRQALDEIGRLVT